MSDGLRDAFVENDVIGNFSPNTYALGSVPSRKSKRKTRKSRKKTRHTRRRSHRKRRTHKRNSSGIKYTKNGQPYKILANGRARFIKGKRRK